MSYNQKIRTGWFLYLPVEPNSPHKAFMWVEIKDHWLMISKRHDDSPFISLNLGLSTIKLENLGEANVSSNSIIVETTDFQKGSSICLTSKNRFDLLAFCKGYIGALEAWKDYMQYRQVDEQISFDCIDNSTTVIGEELSISIDSKCLNIQRSTNNVVQISFENIQNCKPIIYDETYGFKLEIEYNNGEKLLLKCASYQDMITIVNNIHYRLTMNSAANQSPKMMQNNLQAAQMYAMNPGLMQNQNMMFMPQFAAMMGQAQPQMAVSPQFAASPMFQFNAPAFYNNMNSPSFANQQFTMAYGYSPMNNSPIMTESSFGQHQMQTFIPASPPPPPTDVPVPEPQKAPEVPPPEPEKVEEPKEIPQPEPEIPKIEEKPEETEKNEEEEEFKDPFDEEEFF